MRNWHIVAYCPAYNVSSSIGELVERTAKAAKALAASGAQLDAMIVVDDGSTDATAAKLSAAKKSAPFLHVLKKKKNEGAAAAVIDGMKSAASFVREKRLPLKNTIVVRMDADLEHQPEDIGAVVAPIISGKAKASVGFARIDSRNGFLAEWFNRTVGLSESRKFLGLDIPQFAPGFNAARADVFASLVPQVLSAEKRFKAETGKEMVTVDFVILALAHAAGERLAVVKLRRIENKRIKKPPLSKILAYYDYHRITARFLEKELGL